MIEAETEMLAMLIMMLSHLHLDYPGRLNSTRWEVLSKGAMHRSHSFCVIKWRQCEFILRANVMFSSQASSVPNGQLVSALTTLASSHWDGRPSVLSNMPSVYTEQSGREECLEKW